jgi:hypothetical protein
LHSRSGKRDLDGRILKTSTDDNFDIEASEEKIGTSKTQGKWKKDNMTTTTGPPPAVGI